MKKIKIILILLIMLVVCISISISILVLSSNTNDNYITDEKEYVPTIIVEENLRKVTTRNNYYTVKNIIEDYYSSLCRLNQTDEDVLIFQEDKVQENVKFDVSSNQLENRKKRIYGFFEESCINEIGLNTNNIQEKLGNYKDLFVLINDMYVRELTETLRIYFVYGEVTEKENLQKEKFEFMLLVDSQNARFNLYTSEYVKKHNLFELSKNEDFKEKYFNIESVENRIYNKYDFELVEDEKYSKDLLNSFKESIKYNNIDFSYEKLHENYKTGRFKEKSDYEKYIQNNKKKIMASNLKYYQVKNVDGYTQYICVDGNENYYIFNEKNIMDYTLILDTYTVDLPEIVEKYKLATNIEKVEMNVKKIFEAINQNDYIYIYNKLDNTFKKNNFPTQNDMKKYIENNFSENNIVENMNISQEGNLYICKTKLNDKYFNIVMQLGEGTDFTISFSFDK